MVTPASLFQSTLLDSLWLKFLDADFSEFKAISSTLLCYQFHWVPGHRLQQIPGNPIYPPSLLPFPLVWQGDLILQACWTLAWTSPAPEHLARICQPLLLWSALPPLPGLDAKLSMCQGYSLWLTGTWGLVGEGGVKGVFEAFRSSVVLNRNLKNVRDVPRFDLRLFSRLV